MRIIKPSWYFERPIIADDILRNIERFGRTCYKSQDRITSDSAEKFVKGLVKRGHESVLEHEIITVRIICDRGISHELVRHRIASYTQESTRYCNYCDNKFGRELTFIKPSFWDEDGIEYQIWESALSQIESAYFSLINLGAKPEEARSILPNSLKTEIVMTMNIREWRHFFKLRTSKAAHPQMREIALPMLSSFYELLPVLFGDIKDSSDSAEGINQFSV